MRKGIIGSRKAERVNICQRSNTERVETPPAISALRWLLIYAEGPGMPLWRFWSAHSVDGGIARSLIGTVIPLLIGPWTGKCPRTEKTSLMPAAA
jgi:hypothetical protein